MKVSLSIILLIAVPLAASAQLKVYSNGKVNINCDSQMSMTDLSVGQEYHPNWYSDYQNGIRSKVDISNGNYNIGVWGDATYDYNINSGRSYGVMGLAGFSTNGYNYGVFGKLYGSQNGAGVFGSYYNSMGVCINGQYAGYFLGPVYVSGTLTATNVITPSDIRLKEKIVPLVEIDKCGTLNNLLSMNVIEYSYKASMIPETEGDTLSTSLDESNKQTERHYGLSAQELQAIYPNLVKEGQDGYLGVNYVELVPVLIRAIQELKGELDAVRSNDGARKTSSTTDVNSVGKGANVLYQNAPNPFKEQTTIRFSLADDAQEASICIFDMTGKMLKKQSISLGETSVRIAGWELGEGMFFYTLIVNGREIDTKRMILLN